MRKSVVLLSVFAFFSLAIHCTAAGADKDREVVIHKRGGGFRLGVIVANPDKDFLKEHNLDGGVVVLDVFDDSPADEAGIEEDDIIVKFDGKPVGSAEALADMVEKIEEEKNVTVVVNRDGKDKSLSVALKPADETAHQVTVDVDDDDIDVLVDEALRAPHVVRHLRRHSFPPLPDEKGGYLGVRGSDLSDQLKEYFEVEHGILVEEVVKDSPADKAGIRAGDVIYRINDRDIKDFGDLIRTINYYNPDEQITVYYVRKGKKGEAKVTLGKRKGPGFPPMKMPPRPEDFHFFFNGYPGMKHIKHIKKKLPMLDEDIKILVL